MLEWTMALGLVGCGRPPGAGSARTAPTVVESDASSDRAAEQAGAAEAGAGVLVDDAGVGAVDPLADRPCLWGCPSGARNDQGELLERKLYTLRNNDTTKFADWVAYEVRAERIGPTQNRYWKADPELDADDTLEPDDYTGAHDQLQTDRGHQAPLASFTSDPDWKTTNYLSNITPQRSALNQGPWMRLEARVRDLARQEGVVFVVTGPLYEHAMAPLPGADEPHQVPSGYWKVILLEDGRMAAFLFEQDTERSYEECEAAEDLDEVERRSGYDLLPLLGEPEGAPLRDARDELCPEGG